MAITTEELRKWISEDRRHGVNINSGVLNDISAELITARAKLEAATETLAFIATDGVHPENRKNAARDLLCKWEASQ